MARRILVKHFRNFVLCILRTQEDYKKAFEIYTSSRLKTTDIFDQKYVVKDLSQ
ncbi:hypothetical protein E4U54_002280 [Claviceps lovelessii]|nr:hypothetical protein E4U54_002280 [Claviceps lovelessii]